MLVHVIRMGRVVVSPKQLDERDGLGELIHAALGSVERDTGNALVHDIGTRPTHEPRNGLQAARIVGNPLAGAEILHASMHLRANRHRRRSSRARNGAVLLDRDDTLATKMAFGRVHTGLEQNYPIRILFGGE